MPTISISREYSTSKNIKLYLMSPAAAGEYLPLVSNTETGQVGWDKFNPLDFNGITGWKRSWGASGNKSMTIFGLNKIPNLQEIPDLAAGTVEAERDTIEITTLEDEYHEFADGLRNRDTDTNSLSFTFLYDGECYNALRRAIDGIDYMKEQERDIMEDASSVQYKENETSSYHLYYLLVVLPNGSIFGMKIKNLSLTLAGAGVSAALTFTLNCEIDGEIEYKHPGAADSQIFGFAGVLDGDDYNVKGIEYSGGSYQQMSSNISGSILAP